MNPSVKVAQPGWDVNTAPDWALIFNSAWPSLQIAFEQTFVVKAGDDILLTANHNLGYVPLTMAWLTTANVNYGRLPAVEADSANAYLGSSLDISTDASITIRCYNIDITKEASYPLPSSAAAKTAPDTSTFIKIVKQNPSRNIHSKNLNDFILNSQAQSPAVLSVATQTGQYYNATAGNNGGPAIVYPLQTPYIPWVVGAVALGQPDGYSSVYQYYSTQGLLYDTAANSLILEFGAIGSAASLIVLRDPLFYPNTVRVVY